MGEYAFKRLISTVGVLLGVTLLTFSILFILPGDPAEMLAMSKYGALDANREVIEQIKKEQGLDRPIPVQYALWAWGVAKGDLGKSRLSGKSVSGEIMTRLAPTFALAGSGLLISLFVGVSLGGIAAVRQNTFLDYFCIAFSLAGVAIPNFWLGLMLILFFGIYLNILPTFGYGTMANLILPAVTLGISMAGVTARLTRSSVLEVLGQDYIKTARSKGLPRRIILSRHVMKNALLPIVTISGIQFGYLLEGTVIVETVFAWPGIGRLLINAVHNRDFPLIQGCVLYIAFVFSLVNLLVDISYTWLDPRVRLYNHE